MALNFVESVDRDVLSRAADSIADLVTAPEVAAAWEREWKSSMVSATVLPRLVVIGPAAAVATWRSVRALFQDSY